VDDIHVERLFCQTVGERVDREPVAVDREAGRGLVQDAVEQEVGDVNDFRVGDEERELVDAEGRKKDGLVGYLFVCV
jgi:hypothetical protein